MVVTKTTAITNSQSITNIHENNLNNINVNLPQIGGNQANGNNRKNLAAIDDYNAEDSYDERVP